MEPLAEPHRGGPRLEWPGLPLTTLWGLCSVGSGWKGGTWRVTPHVSLCVSVCHCDSLPPASTSSQAEREDPLSPELWQTLLAPARFSGHLPLPCPPLTHLPAPAALPGGFPYPSPGGQGCGTPPISSSLHSRALGQASNPETPGIDNLSSSHPHPSSPSPPQPGLPGSLLLALESSAPQAKMRAPGEVSETGECRAGEGAVVMDSVDAPSSHHSCCRGARGIESRLHRETGLTRLVG